MGPRDLWLRLRSLVAPRRVERELDEELAFHIEMQARKHLAAGLSATEARRRAHAQFGSTAFVEDECRDARGVAFVNALFQDVRYAIRSFRRTPTFALTVVGTIALGLGLNGALFTIFNAYVLRADAVRDPGALYSFTWSTRLGIPHQFNLREYERLTAENEVFTAVLARRTQVRTRISGQDVRGQLVTGNYFQMLGVRSALGRMLTPADSVAPGGEAVVVLSFPAWQRLFDRETSIIGRTILINGHPCEVVGIAPREFSGLDVLPPDFWAPITLNEQLSRFPSRAGPNNPDQLEIIGRLKAGIAEPAARAALILWARRMTTERSDEEPAQQIVLESHAASIPFSPRVLLLISPLLTAFALVLIIACANVANLMLARALARRREIAIRLSLGASRWRIVRQLMTESLLLALAAAVIGFLVSLTTITLVSSALFSTLPAEAVEFVRLLPLDPDIRLAGFLTAAAVVTALAFGLLPALHATRTSLVQAARDTLESHGRPGRARQALLVLQITASALLLISAGVLLRGTSRIGAKQPDVRTADVLAIKIDERARPAITQALLAEPTVVSLAATWPDPPYAGSPRPVAAAPGGTSTLRRTTYQFASPDYFGLFGIDLLSGRMFTEQEARSGAGVAIVSTSAARDLWPDGDAVGRTLRLERSQGMARYANEPPLPAPVVQVIGVVRDVSSDRADENIGIYVPISRLAANTTLVASVHGDPEAARRTLDQLITGIDPRGVQQIFKMQTFVALQTYLWLVAFWVATALGALALALTICGIYGVLSYLVTQRTKEIGIRMALGGTAGAVTRMVLAQSLRLVTVGLAAGACMAWAASKAAGSLPRLSRVLAAIDTLDPIAYIGSLLVVLAACIAAASLPALRAARVDPIATLRHD